MLGDPFYRQIHQALEGPLDPLVFERCMGDLLRKDYPWIVPVSGGTDSGMDGAIADGEGEPFPLVCTTADDLLRNLTRNLDSYKKSGLRRKIVLATSRSLTPQKQANLYKRAREKGFDLLQIFEREAVADRLAGSPRWCKELLGLTWKPSALSTVPPRSRPLIDIEPVGREADLAWIEGTPGDRVLSGEPGSGKTFLFRYLMRKRDWPGLFLADSDLSRFRDAWVEQQRPKVVVVDDAHIDPDLLSRLVRLREEMDASFEIVASTWEGGREEVMEALGVPALRVRNLELLTRNEILQVILQVGVQASDEVLRDLVSQAANKPGLAVTIASLWRQGSYEEVLEGTALTRTLTTFFRRFLGPESTAVLACLALGGDRGMSLEAIGNALHIPPLSLGRITAGLASGGVLSAVERDTWAVWPRELRFSLLRSVFFSGAPAPVDYRTLLDLAPSREKAVETIVDAKLHRAEIPSDELRALVAWGGSRDSWRGLAHLGKADALWVLEHYTADVVDVAGAALNQAGEAAVLRLLKRAETASGQPWFRADDPLRVLQGWIQEFDVELDEMLRRRKLLARTSQKYLHAGGKRSVALQGICLAFSPSLEGSSTDPGGGRVTMYQDILPLEQLRETASLWLEVRGEFDRIEAEDWQYLSSFLWNWVHPSYASKGGRVSKESERLMRDFAAGVLSDLAPLARGKPFLAAKVRELAKGIGIDLRLEPDPVFERLFPSMADCPPGWQRHERERESSLDELARQWVSREPAEIAELLVGYEREAQRFGQPVGGCRDICYRLARQVDAPAWLDALLAQGASGALTEPFLKRIVSDQKEGWEQQARRFLELEPQHARSAVEAIVRLHSTPAALLNEAMKRLTEDHQLLEFLCVRREIPIEPLRALLRDSRREVALTAAVGEWNADQGVRPEVAADWRVAVLGTKVDDPRTEALSSSLRHMLGVILSKDPELAFEWLVARLRDPERPYSTYERDPHALALSALGREQRIQLVEELEKGQVPKGFVRLLVGKDPEVFRRVLSSEIPRSHHLEPLGFLPDESWMGLALMAQAAGHEADEIIEATLWPQAQVRIQSITGLELWQRHEHAFAQLEADPREQARALARRGRQFAKEQVELAEKRQREFAIHGRFV